MVWNRKIICTLGQFAINASSKDRAHKRTVNTIFDVDNYIAICQNDLLTAEKEIIISSLAIHIKNV